MSLWPRGSCRLYSEFCRATRPAREAYKVAASRLGLSWEREAAAAHLASQLSMYSGVDTCRVLGMLYRLIPGSRVCVLWPGASRIPEGCDVVAAPESLPVRGVRYDIVAGDLDSRWDPYVLSAHARLLLIHFHGDNYTRLPSRLSPWPSWSMLAFTSQAYCMWPVLGVGGFTDGDRLVVLAMALGAREVLVAPFEAGRVDCGHKLYCDPRAKREKLMVGLEVLGRAASMYNYVAEARREELRFIPHSPGT